MNFNILVTGGVYSTQSGYSALQFCSAAVAAGHTISQVFFYQDGVTQGSSLLVPLADEYDANEHWARFSQETGAELVVCVSAGERRGVLNAEQAAEFAKPANNLHPAFRVEGLGTLHEASIGSDRMVTFK